MAIAVTVTGPAHIYFASSEMGYTRNGVEIREEARWHDVPGDQNGGDEGPPIDVQYLGEVHHVRAELTKYDAANVALIHARVGSTPGTAGAAGTLMFASSEASTLLISCVNPTSGATTTRTYTRAFPRQPVELNKGTKFSTLVCEFECHKNDAGVLYT